MAVYWLWGDGSAKGQWPMLSLMPDTSLSPCVPLMPFRRLPWCWSSEGAILTRWVHVWVPQEELHRALSASSTNSIPAGFHSQKLWGLIFPALESWARCPGVDLGLLVPEISLPDFYLLGCRVSLFCIHASPSRLDECGFFNSIVVRLPLNLIIDVPERWLFYILVVILICLCKNVSHVCLHHHLDQKPIPKS